MTVSCPRAGQIWGTDAMVETMRELQAMGVNWIAIHPYGRIDGSGEVGAMRMSLEGNPVWLRRPIEEAHALGLKIMIKPHLAHWHSPWSWRGAIDFETEDEWDLFFTTYEQWITQLAAVCHDADAFVVATELDRTVQHEERWRVIIDAVRKRTDAKLTYAANWDTYRNVPFWDALDVIGVQAYFPLVDEEGVPPQWKLTASWRRIVEEMEAFGGAQDRKVVLTELGYRRSAATAQRPWETRRGVVEPPEAEEVQRRCLDTALRSLDDSEIVGAFLWKWFPGEMSRGSHQMSTPAMRAVIAECWGETSGTMTPSTGKGS